MKCDFPIKGVSYVGQPTSNTAMYISGKVSNLLGNLYDAEQCLVFAETDIDVPERLLKKHQFVFSEHPQLEYSLFIQSFAEEKEEEERRKKYTVNKEGFYIGENVSLGKDCYIEPMCLIGHGVVIGDHARILAGTIIKNAVIGNYLLANEYSVIGANGFTMTESENGDKIRIPTLGKVRIGNHVEVGTHDNISCGSGGDTVIEDNVKLDTQVHIGHDVHLHKNVTITAGAIIGGFAEIGDGSFVGINATLRNRVKVGEKGRISMGAVATREVADGQTVTGNFAVEHSRFLAELKEANQKASETQGGGQTVNIWHLAGSHNREVA